MGGDPLRNYRAGERLKGIDHRLLNTIVELAAARVGAEFGRDASRLAGFSTAMPLAENATGGNLDQYSVCAYEKPAFTQSAATDQFKHKPSIKLKTPASGATPDLMDMNRVAITLRICGAGDLVPVAMAGIVRCQVDIVDATHRYAVFIDGDHAKLRSHWCRGVPILNMEGSSGVNWCEVLLPPAVEEIGMGIVHATHTDGPRTSAKYSAGDVTPYRYQASSDTWVAAAVEEPFINLGRFQMESGQAARLRYMNGAQFAEPIYDRVPFATWSQSGSWDCTTPVTPATTLVNGDYDVIHGGGSPVFKYGGYYRFRLTLYTNTVVHPSGTVGVPGYMSYTLPNNFGNPFGGATVSCPAVTAGISGPYTWEWVGNIFEGYAPNTVTIAGGGFGGAAVTGNYVAECRIEPVGELVRMVT